MNSRFALAGSYGFFMLSYFIREQENEKESYAMMNIFVEEIYIYL
jgi:hypothetical protein